VIAFLLNIQSRTKKMTVHVEFDIPVYRLDQYEQLERYGRIKVSSNVETFEEGTLSKEYERLKKEIEVLIADMNARTRLAAQVSELEDQLRWKGQNLRDILKDIERATAHYNALKTLLEKFGVLNLKAASLNFDTNFLLSEASSQVEATPTQIYPGSEF
jgi:DNA repair exonuclease SbcCD ATPase subunit